MGSCFGIKKQTKDEELLLKNGSMLLEKLIASSNGKCNPIRAFSAEELSKATNDYNVGQEISRYVHFVLYKGFLHGREISVKRYNSHSKSLETAITDIVISSQMSVHKNVLKLIGCCLETQNPVLVYEFGGDKNLKRLMFDICEGQPESLTWKSRIKIAMDIANAVAYLHTALSRPIIHQGLSLISIVMDTNCVAKLSDFSLSIAIPKGKSHVVKDTISGVFGYIAPEVFECRINEKADVFSFGILLLELLTRRKSADHSEEEATFKEFVGNYVENNRLTEIVDQSISSEGINRDDLVTFANIALHCTQENPEDRPMITDVAKQLRQLDKDCPYISKLY
ncbi:non-functional pseudokinase ZED1-like [Durio zibethinus]|uniref:Non-functional pseudokinase ZED1-like n=1 Tax=Durio zibethinus TaxID=66656 RepID=A0A6P5ZDT4_DURZI|nr:non-functional pseudokinase ZED1-like [Durio zibethinus]XP_022750988.1 non-functional pseudokinase ZED1-like [Durio zibethinus]